MQQQISCPRCTAFNHPANDECIMCRMSFGEEGQRNPEAPRPHSVSVTKTCGESISLWAILETMWVFFTISFYTLYTIIVTWTSDTIFQSMYKLAAYCTAFLLLYGIYCYTPFVFRKLVDFFKSIFKSIAEIQTNPLIWIAITILTAWVAMISYEIQIMKDDIGSIHIQIAGIQYNVTALQQEVVILAQRITQVEGNLNALQKKVEDGFETLGNNIKAVDAELVRQTDYWNETYSSYIEGDAWIQKADTYVRETMYSIFSKLSSKTITRSEFGLGCFMKGTKIQMNREGDTVNVEDLVDGDYVYSPALNRSVKIKIMFLYGKETGNMYEITTADSLSVIVTETHPMKICQLFGDRFDCDYNIAARMVHIGNWTETVNGHQEIVSVEQISVKNAFVYNFILDVSDETLISSRDVIADGIYSLDLEAQKQHH